MNKTHKPASNVIVVSAMAISLSLTTGCASIVCGTSQKVHIDSEPRGAKIFVNDEAKGVTPKTLAIKRKAAPAVVRLEKEGYEPEEEHIGQEFNWWYAGNILFGGLIGVVVDAVDGAMWKLDKEDIYAELRLSDGRSATSAPISAKQVQTPSPNDTPAPIIDANSSKMDDELVNSLAKLDEMHRSGVLSDEEHKMQRKRLIEEHSK